MEFLSQRREGAKIVKSLTLRLRERLFPRLSAHVVSHNTQMGGVHRGLSELMHFIKSAGNGIPTAIVPEIALIATPSQALALTTHATKWPVKHQTAIKRSNGLTISSHCTT